MKEGAGNEVKRRREEHGNVQGRKEEWDEREEDMERGKGEEWKQRESKRRKEQMRKEGGKKGPKERRKMSKKEWIGWRTLRSGEVVWKRGHEPEYEKKGETNESREVKKK